MKNSSNTYSLCDTNGQYHNIACNTLIEAAQHCIREGFSAGQAITSPQSAASHCQILLAPEEQEVFYAIWLNSQHHVINHGELSRGTIDSASIYPREVVKTALACNAAAVIFAHNHPSGHAEPSQADIQITKRLTEALSLINIRVLDHMIVAESVTSMAERGLL